MDNNITHEDLAGISQYDWYLSCYQTNSPIRLEDAKYAVVCMADDSIKVVIHHNLTDLNNWAGL